MQSILRPDFYADNPVNSRSLSIFYVDLYSSVLPSLLCGRGNQPDRKHWQNKKVALGRSLSRSGMIYGLGPPLEGEKNKRETEPNTPNIPFTTPVGRQPRRQRCSRRDRPHVLQKVTPTEKRPRKNVPREQSRRRRRRSRKSRKRRTC